MSMRFTIEINPDLTETCLGFIEENITPSMISLDHRSGQYALDYTYETLSDVMEGNKDTLFGIHQSDLQELKRLLDAGVDFIEL